ncbi:50S ribosomal protein L25 [Dolosicoccus paucivorans]|uniref:Large ribosomal subunit protein bL25 n=1 Tax=Dolosicoccus paucivorans TaxID=84521 RepID=A0A2N6SMR8_9LACT|nr:50S ribosomal protein L25 [Dolosicoccus paucivorans]PMB84104.1 50S ribosomal protein L25 [Dolosicoccus paucivorans]PMC58352.1 50S ribosomal protein L25 [Dolosicoccus paucivorans]
MKLNAKLRTEVGTGAARRDRRAGLVPVSMYGEGKEAVSLLVDRRKFENLLRTEGENAVFEVEYDGNTQTVFMKSFERAALKDVIYDIELQAISADQRLEVEVPVHVINDDTIKVGIVNLVRDAVLVSAKATAIPSHFTVDVEGMEIGDLRAMSDLELPEGVESLEEADETVVTVTAPEEEPEDVDPDAEVSEPEVIGESDDNEEDAE